MVVAEGDGGAAISMRGTSGSTHCRLVTVRAVVPTCVCFSRSGGDGGEGKSITLRMLVLLCGSGGEGRSAGDCCEGRLI